MAPFQLTEHCMYPTQKGPHHQQLQWQRTSKWTGLRYATPGGAGKLNTVACNSVDGLVMVESLVFKKLGNRVAGWWNAAAMTIPAVLHEIQCTAATDQVAAALGCAMRVTVFVGLAGQMYTSVPGLNQSQSRSVAGFFEHRMFLYIKPQDKLSQPNVRERGALPTDRALHVPNLGRTPLTAIAHFPFATHLSSNGWPMCSRESRWTA